MALQLLLAVQLTRAAGTGGPRPCDIFGAAGTPCVAAHSTVRGLYQGYTGPLYRLQRGYNNATKDINAELGGYANASAHDGFCRQEPCVVAVIYDQSPHGNHLAPGPGGGHAHQPDRPVRASRDRHIVGGHAVYPAYFEGGMGYRRDNTSGVATGDAAETIYMVAAGDHVNVQCCFDYGNAETNNRDDGKTTMEAAYLGSNHGRGARQGAGPWVMADLENGLYLGGGKVGNQSLAVPYAYVTAMLKGRTGGSFALKAADAAGGGGAGRLVTQYDGPRPAGYSVMRKQGAIILGIGGDNSNQGVGTFFEGAMTAGVASDAVDEAVQTSIVAAGYGQDRDHRV